MSYGRPSFPWSVSSNCVELLRKALRGDIALPIVRIETSQKTQRGVHLVDLAASTNVGRPL